LGFEIYSDQENKQGKVQEPDPMLDMTNSESMMATETVVSMPLATNSITLVDY